MGLEALPQDGQQPGDRTNSTENKWEMDQACWGAGANPPGAESPLILTRERLILTAWCFGSGCGGHKLPAWPGAVPSCANRELGSGICCVLIVCDLGQNRFAPDALEKIIYCWRVLENCSSWAIWPRTTRSSSNICYFRAQDIWDVCSGEI